MRKLVLRDHGGGVGARGAREAFVQLQGRKSGLGSRFVRKGQELTLGLRIVKRRTVESGQRGAVRRRLYASGCRRIFRKQLAVGGKGNTGQQQRHRDNLGPKHVCLPTFRAREIDDLSSEAVALTTARAFLLCFLNDRS